MIIIAVRLFCGRYNMAICGILVAVNRRTFIIKTDDARFVKVRFNKRYRSDADAASRDIKPLLWKGVVAVCLNYEKPTQFYLRKGGSAESFF